MAAVILSSTESVFYCMSVYFGITKVRKTRFVLPGALIATIAGVAAAVWITDSGKILKFYLTVNFKVPEASASMDALYSTFL